jgi:formylglycine-generating enzyme required for sulfatase activity
VGDIHRCNHGGEEDGFAGTAPVGSFPGFPSPYGAEDMAGNVAEWTLDWYSTSHHAGIDGYRMRRGGSWRSVPEGVDGVSGATSLPLQGSGIVGFRGVLPERETRSGS